MPHTTTSSLLKSVLTQPTAPFREGWVREELSRVLTRAGVSSFIDSTGNLIAGASSWSELHRGRRLGLVAHMDHPGFHLGERVRGSRYSCYWYGGAPFAQMKGAKVRLFDPESRERQATGVVVSVGPVDLKKEGQPFVVAFDQDIQHFSRASFGAFDLPAFQKKGDRIFTRSADDLAGCVIAAGALIDQARRPKKTRIRLFAVFTRAEEVGFVGCTDLILKQNKKSLPRSASYLSLEASRALPEAELGRGPVLRIGDRWTVFDPELSYLLNEAALKLAASPSAAKTSTFRFQRRLMSGGICEATPLTVSGYRVSGLAVPLLNYHNQPLSSARAGQTKKSGPQPEIISLSDTENARKLCAFLPAFFSHHPGYALEVKKKVLREYRLTAKLLKAKIDFDLGEPS